MTPPTMIASDLARAARAITKVSVRTVAEAAGLPEQTVRDFEQGRISMSGTDNNRLREALEEYGVLFIPEDHEAGYGVRQKFNSSKSRRLDMWEHEGGPAYEDDI